MSGFTSDLLVGLAVYLDACNIGEWSASGAYTDNQTAITIGMLPSSPDRVITLEAYGVSDHSDLSDSTVGVQVRCRWDGEDPRSVADLADSVFDLLHGRAGLRLSTGVLIGQCLRNSGPTSMGMDDNRRWSNIQNFYVYVHRPSTNRA